jgi:hypothetical protein
MPSISVIGYVMVLDIRKKSASGELAQPRCPRDDLAHLIRSDFVTAEPEKFTSDALNLAHAKTETHQPGTHGHQPAAHQSGEATTVGGDRNHGSCARNLVNQCLNLVGRPLGAMEIQDDTDGFFSDSTVDAGLYGQPPYQLVHIAPPSTGDFTGRYLSKDYLELPKNEIQAITSDESAFDLHSPIKCCSNARVDAKTAENSRGKRAPFDFWRNKIREIVRLYGMGPAHLRRC